MSARIISVTSPFEPADDLAGRNVHLVLCTGLVRAGSGPAADLPTEENPMTMTTLPADSSDRFDDSEYLRRVLIRICDTPDGWRTDPEAEDLIRHAADRFAQLAVKHGLEPADAMSAVFEAMRNPSVRFGKDPWAVIVTAVATTFRAWQFADEALTSIETARRGRLSGCRAERFSERDLPVWERHPGFAVDGIEDGQESDSWDGPTIPEQARELAGLFTGRGWPGRATVVAVEIVLRKLADCGSRPSAYESLRREKRWRAMTGLPGESWTGLLRALLGCPSDCGLRDAGKGVLLRLALGETVAHLMGDEELCGLIDKASPASVKQKGAYHG